MTEERPKKKRQTAIQELPPVSYGAVVDSLAFLESGYGSQVRPSGWTAKRHAVTVMTHLITCYVHETAVLGAALLHEALVCGVSEPGLHQVSHPVAEIVSYLPIRPDLIANPWGYLSSYLTIIGDHGRWQPSSVLLADLAVTIQELSQSLQYARAAEIVIATRKFRASLPMHGVPQLLDDRLLNTLESTMGTPAIRELVGA